MGMAKREQKEQKPTARPKKKGARPQTTPAVKKSVAKKKTAATKKEAKKSEPARSRPKKMPAKEWLEMFFSRLIVVQLQEFFRWCWENIDKKQTHEIAVALYREIFFPFESMPEHKRLPIWRHRRVGRFIHALTSAQATRLENIARQWAEETGQNLGSSEGRPGVTRLHRSRVPLLASLRFGKDVFVVPFFNPLPAARCLSIRIKLGADDLQLFFHGWSKRFNGRGYFRLKGHLGQNHIDRDERRNRHKHQLTRLFLIAEHRPRGEYPPRTGSRGQAVGLARARSVEKAR